MQASESGYNTLYPRRPNGITDPRYSIECGIQALRDALTRADVSSPTDMVNIRIALQGYNFGSGFVIWFRNKGYTEWSFEIACEFAESTGWGRRSDPNHVAGPWNYGDQHYPEHVLRYYTVSSGSVLNCQRTAWLFLFTISGSIRNHTEAVPLHKPGVGLHAWQW